MGEAEAEAIEFATVRAQTMADDTLRLTVDVEPRHAQEAFRMFGQRGVHGAMARLNLDPAAVVREPRNGEAPQKGPHGQFWHELIRSGFFRVPTVLRAIGTERDFEAWIRQQPSALDGEMDWDPETGEGRCEPAHVRRVSEGAGTAEKPPYFATPLTHQQHRFQHDQGEEAALAWFGPPNVEMSGSEWFQAQADRHRTEWASRRLAERLDPDVGGQSRSLVAPDMVVHWIEKHGFERYAPKSTR